MENPSERIELRRAELLDKHRDIIAKAAKWLELEREREIERISQANRAAALAEQNLINSNENELRMKNRKAIRQKLRFKKADQRASRRRAMNGKKKTVEIADGASEFPLLMDATSKLAKSSSQTVVENLSGLRLVQETEDDVREFLKSINSPPCD